MHIGVFYPRYTIYDKANEFRPFSAGPGNLFLHRTFDKHPNIQYTIFPFDKYEHWPSVAELTSCTHYLILGADWIKRLFPQPDFTFESVRGYCLSFNNKPTIATYSPLDCFMFNAADDERKAGQPIDEKNVGLTRRRNYLFWALADFDKLIRPPSKPTRHTAVYQILNYDSLFSTLRSLPPTVPISLDIETRRADHCLDCIGLGLILPQETKTYCIPIYHHTDRLAHPPKQLARLYKVLTHLLLNNPIIGHNLSFDLSVLHYYYHLPIPKTIHDTMLFMHRHHPAVDKSLHHAICYYTHAQRSHKADIRPNTSADNETQLLRYNHQDVYWTAEIYRRQQELAAADSALASAAAAAFAAQYTTLLMSFTGITVDADKLSAAKFEVEQKLAALQRIIRMLTDNADLNPNSTDQMKAYFYSQLNYEPPYLTEAGVPALDEEALYKLQLAQPNPIIPLLIEYRSAAKELSALNFIPYKQFTSAL